MQTPEKEIIRNSILTHLQTWQGFGVKHIMSKRSLLKNLVEKPVIQTQTDVTDILADTLEKLEEGLQGCQRCRLCEQRQNIVFGSGDPHAKLMFVGESPGADEDAQGKPFVGAAGQLLTKIITAMGLTREAVYIANIVKCRPPENRNPQEDEIASCLPFLKQQIQLIQPRIIMCLGKFAAQTLLDTQIPISKLRGQFRELDGIKVMPSFHPAYLLRNPNMKRLMWEDCQSVMKALAA